jgi:hypothetical protein
LLALIIFDTSPESKILDYIEYCSESGWHHIFSSGKIHIFYSVDDNPVPIQTDENMKLKLVSRATILLNWGWWIFLPLIWGFSIGSKILNPKYFYSYSIYLTEMSEVGMVAFCLGFTLLSIVSMLRFGNFYFRNIIRLKNGLGIQYYSLKNVKRFDIFRQIYSLSLLVLMAIFSMQDDLLSGYMWIVFIGMILMAFLISKIAYSKWTNRKVNIVITIVFPIVAVISVLFSIVGMKDDKLPSGNSTCVYSTDDIDLTLDDLGVDKPDNFLYEETIHDKSESFLGMREEYSDYHNTEDNSYGYSIEIFSSNYKSIMNKYNKLVLEDGGYTYTALTQTKNTWYSDQVFYGKRGYVSRYVVIGDAITFVIDGDLNQEQAAELSSYYMNK